MLNDRSTITLMRQRDEMSIDCVYTLITRERLTQAMKKNNRLDEKTRWVTAERLWRKGQPLTVIFANARKCKELLAWAKLTKVRVFEDGTEFSVSKLYDLGPLTRRKLIVASTGEPIPEEHIRPYVLCKVPQVLSALAKRPVPWPG
jgi:hypothetical protein